MVQKFTKKELQRLGCNNEEIDLVMKYQRKLPILSEDNDTSGFTIDARILHEQLGVKKKFATWIKSNLKDYFENVDYITGSPRETDMKTSVFTKEYDYYLTVSLAKEIAMFTGKNSQASENLKEVSRTVRLYFILMERIVKDNRKWLSVRFPERKEYNDMCEMLSKNIYKHSARSADKYDYSREANIINIIATGSPAQEIRHYFGLTNNNELTRDSLEKDYNEKLAFLQKQNIIYLGLDMPIIERVKMLIASFDVIYPTASPILPWLSRENIKIAREKLLESLSI